MYTESKLWKALLRQHGTDKSIFLQRIETSTTTGVPDLWWCAEGQSGWLELKVIDHWPLLASQQVKIPSYTWRQRQWLARVYSLNVRIGIVLAVGDTEVLWFDGLSAIQLGCHWNRTSTCLRATAHGIGALLRYVKGV